MSTKILVFLICFVTSINAPACPKTDPSIEKALEAARKARTAGDSAAADRLLSSILKTEPENVRALYIRGLVRIDQKEFATAEQDIAKAAAVQHACTDAITAPDYSVYNTLGWVQMVQGKTKQAEENYKTAIEGIGNSNTQAVSQAKVNLGSLYFAQGRFNDAKPILTEASIAGSQNAARMLEQLAAAQAELDKQIVPRIFVQVSDHVPKEAGEATVKALKSWNYNVPSLQVVTTAPKNNEIRYFYADDKATAQALAARLTSANLGTYNVKAFDSTAVAPTVPKKQLEVWVAN